MLDVNIVAVRLLCLSVIMLPQGYYLKGDQIYVDNVQQTALI